MRQPALETNWKELRVAMRKLGEKCPPRPKTKDTAETQVDIYVDGIRIQISTVYTHEARLQFGNVGGYTFMDVSIDQIPLAVAYMRAVRSTVVAFEKNRTLGKYIGTVYTAKEKAAQKKAEAKRRKENSRRDPNMRHGRGYLVSRGRKRGG